MADDIVGCATRREAEWVWVRKGRRRPARSQNQNERRASAIVGGQSEGLKKREAGIDSIGKKGKKGPTALGKKGRRRGRGKRGQSLGRERRRKGLGKTDGASGRRDAALRSHPNWSRNSTR
eukprot:1919934-Rhodomonas_salina.3